MLRYHEVDSNGTRSRFVLIKLAPHPFQRSVKPCHRLTVSHSNPICANKCSRKGRFIPLCFVTSLDFLVLSSLQIDQFTICGYLSRPSSPLPAVCSRHEVPHQKLVMAAISCHSLVMNGATFNMRHVQRSPDIQISEHIVRILTRLL